MLHEYAVDPRGLGRLGQMWMLMEQFGVSKGRIIVEFPAAWLRLVHDAVIESDCPDVEKLSIFERLKRLKKSLAKPDGAREFCGQNWLESALLANIQRKFTAIVSDTIDMQRPELLAPIDATEDNPKWRVSTGCVIPRTAEQIAACAAPLGRISKELLFVDPYLCDNADRLRVIREILKTSGVEGRSFRRIELHLTRKCGVLSAFQKKFREFVVDRISTPISVEIFQWEAKVAGDIMHARYLLTERGGIRFDFGLAEGDSGETTDVQLLDQRIYETRWNDFQTDTAAYELIERLVV